MADRVLIAISYYYRHISEELLAGATEVLEKAGAKVEHALWFNPQPLQAVQQTVADLGSQEVGTVEAAGGTGKGALDLVRVDARRQ